MVVEVGAGELVGGRYRLIAPVGEGAMGRVWRSHDETLGREVAVKEILLPRGLDGNARKLVVARAIREARAAARLDHPGIITVHDVVDHLDSPMIVMAFIGGRSLAETIHDDGRLPPERVAQLGAALLDALVEAHEAGIVHRDLKPANILLAGKRVIITDFGIASLAGDATLTQVGALMGTPAYMSPEQAHGEPATPASDLWSLGATLYHAVEGHPPYTGPNVTAVLAALLTRDPEPPLHAGPLSPLLTALLRKDPAQRATGGDVARMLDGLTAPGPQGTLRMPDPFGPAADDRPRPSAAEPVRDPRPVTARAAAQLGPPLSGFSRQVSAIAAGTLGDRPIAITASLAGGMHSTVQVWDLETRQRIGRLGNSKPPGAEQRLTKAKNHQYAVWSVAFGHRQGVPIAATASQDASVRIWDLRDQRHLGVLTGHSGQVLAVACGELDDRSIVVSGGVDKTVRVWDLRGDRRISVLTGHSAQVLSVACGRLDGRAIAVSGAADGTVRVWDLALGRQTGSALTGHTGHVLSVAQGLLDGRPIAVTGGQDATVRLWDLRDLRQISAWKGHDGPVTSVACEQTGDHPIVVSGGEDGTVQIWDPAGDRQRGPALTGHTPPVISLATGRLGDRPIAISGGDASVRIWDLGAS